MATKNKPVTINGVTIQPGERGVIELPIGKLYTHINVNIPLQVICGKTSGPTLFISAAIHGDELNGKADVECLRGDIGQVIGKQRPAHRCDG